ncbi:MAG: prepilin-type N-terminal cleavage/methylation domain-containing protein [Phycisphaerae bacterium]|nr:prepilin-type N-terminal cleavage/methylation domain-containing protein [Phycisphaerae bacterium]
MALWRLPVDVTRRYGLTGFTLIELLAVLGILGLLLAIVLPALSSVRESGQRTVCACHLREIGLGLDMYTDNHASWYPTAESAGEEPGPPNWWQNPAFLAILGQKPDPQANSILVCPSDAQPDRCADGSLKGFPASYGANTSAFGMRRGRSKRGRQRNQIRFPTLALTFCDVLGDPHAPHVAGWQPCVNENLAFRHGRRCAVVFADAHADSIRLEDVPLGERAWERPFWGNLPIFDEP